MQCVSGGVGYFWVNCIKAFVFLCVCLFSLVCRSACVDFSLSLCGGSL